MLTHPRLSFGTLLSTRHYMLIHSGYVLPTHFYTISREFHTTCPRSSSSVIILTNLLSVSSLPHVSVQRPANSSMLRPARTPPTGHPAAEFLVSISSQHYSIPLQYARWYSLGYFASKLRKPLVTGDGLPASSHNVAVVYSAHTPS
jgi:hypothetical protein